MVSPRIRWKRRSLVTPANEQERGQVEALGKAVQRAAGNSVTTAFADQGHTGG